MQAGPHRSPVLFRPYRRLSLLRLLLGGLGAAAGLAVLLAAGCLSSPERAPVGEPMASGAALDRVNEGGPVSAEAMDQARVERDSPASEGLERSPGGDGHDRIRTGSAVGAVAISGSTDNGGAGFARRGGSTTGVGASAGRQLPRDGVLASNFVAGGGVTARLETLLDRGVMVGGENLRLEALADRQALPYPVPAEDAVALYADLERTRLHTGRERVHLQLALVARRGEAPLRPPMDVRLVIDRSGSMRGEKWTQAIAAAHAFVDRLAAGDRFGLISYADDATLDFAPAAIGDRRAAHQAVDRLVSGGGTNIGAALELCQSHPPATGGAHGIKLVVLVSDGCVTVGQANPAMLGGIARQLYDDRGALTTTIGLGTDFDEETMLSIAREGSGSYHFVSRAIDIDGILQDELEDRAQSVAQALRLRIELADGVVASKIYGSRLLSETEHAAVRNTEVVTDARIARELGIATSREREEERGLRIHLPTFRRGDQHVVLLELEVPPGTGRSNLATVTLDYKDLRRRDNARALRVVDAHRVPDLASANASVERTVKRTVLAFQAGEALQTAAGSLEAGDTEQALRILGEREALLDAAASLWRDGALRRDATLLSQYRRMIEASFRDWDPSSQHTAVLAMGAYGDRRMR